MSRTDELTDRLTDGTLTDAEAVELESLLAGDPAAQTRHRAAVRLEMALRGLRAEFDLAAPTVAKIEVERVERTTVAVMAELANRPAPDRPRPARRVRAWIALAALAAVAASVLVAVWVGLRSANAPPVADDFAFLTNVSGSVEVVGPAGTTAARSGQPVAQDQTLRTVGEESLAVIEFPDRTRVEIHPESVVRFGVDPARRLILVEGRITTVAVGTRVVVSTGTMDVDVSRGSFSLCSVGSGSARVESVEGDVRVSRGEPVEPAEPVRLEPGRAAFVRDERAPMQIDPPWRADSRPHGRLDFPALDVGFTPAGEVLAVSAKQWAAWVPGAPDPGRTLFPPKVFNDGMAAWLTADRRAVALCRIDDREERIVVRDLPSGAERGRIAVRVSEPRFLCVAPDASWVATVGPKPNDRRVHLWDVASGRERFALDFGVTVPCLTASPDGRTLAVGLSDLGKGTENAVATFDTTSGERRTTLSTRRKAVAALTFSEDGKTLAVGFNGAVQMWGVSGRTLLRTLEGFERVVTRLAFSPAGDLVAAGTQDGQVWVWPTATGRRTQVIEAGTRGVRSLAFSPDGKLLVTATNKAGVAVWDVVPVPADTGDRDS